MRISDWSSDVCSSDLPGKYRRVSSGNSRYDSPTVAKNTTAEKIAVPHRRTPTKYKPVMAGVNLMPAVNPISRTEPHQRVLYTAYSTADRKSVREGRKVSDRVDLGGRSVIKKKN